MSTSSRRFAIAADAVSSVYAVALGGAGVMLTFIAIAEGLSLGTIAALSAAAAAAQFASRFGYGVLYRYLSDRTVMAISFVLLVAAMSVVLVVPGLVGLLIAQVLQGASRSGFWSAVQLHVLRISTQPARGMGRNQFIANGLGAIGPVIAGVIAAGDPRATAWLLGAMCLAGAIGCVTLAPLPVLTPVVRTPDNRLWSSRGLRISAFGSLAGGAYNAVVMTFVPLVFHAAGWPESGVGIVVGVANASILFGAMGGGFIAPDRFAIVVTISTVTIAAGIALLVLVGPAPAVSIGGLVAAGAAAGAVLTLSPTLASHAVQTAQSGSAVVFSGLFRAGALFFTPLAVSAVAVVMPVAAAMIVAGILAGAPGIWTALRR